MKPPTIPNPFEKGQVLTAEQLEMLRQACLYAIQTGVVAGPGLVSSLMGNRTVLALQRQPRAPTTAHPWKLVKSTTALDVEIKGGPVHGWDAVNVRPCQHDVPATTTHLSLTASSTNYIYLQSTMTPTAYENKYIIWTASAFTFFTATAEEENTADFTDAVTGDGNVFVKIGEVETDGTEIIEITQIQTTTINLLWPWTMNLVTFGCPA